MAAPVIDEPLPPDQLLAMFEILRSLRPLPAKPDRRVNGRLPLDDQWAISPRAARSLAAAFRQIMGEEAAITYLDAVANMHEQAAWPMYQMLADAARAWEDEVTAERQKLRPS